jgi:hypothetical protein
MACHHCVDSPLHSLPFTAGAFSTIAHRHGLRLLAQKPFRINPAKYLIIGVHLGQNLLCPESDSGQRLMHVNVIFQAEPRSGIRTRLRVVAGDERTAFQPALGFVRGRLLSVSMRLRQAASSSTSPPRRRLTSSGKGVPSLANAGLGPTKNLQGLFKFLVPVLVSTPGSFWGDCAEKFRQHTCASLPS